MTGTTIEGVVCNGCGKHVTGSRPAGACQDCGGHFVEATEDRLACDRCGDQDASRVFGPTEHSRLCDDCVDHENRDHPLCEDCDRRMIEVDPPETPGPQSFECPECWKHVDADDTDFAEDGKIVNHGDTKTTVEIEAGGRTWKGTAEEFADLKERLNKVEFRD
jgi:hypothetical protein